MVPQSWEQPEVIYRYLDWLYQRAIGAGTREVYRGNLNRTAYWLHSKRGVTLLEAGQPELQAWRAQLCQADRTVALYVTTVKAFYQWAYRSELIPRDPAWSLPSPRIRPGIPRPVREQRLAVMLDLAVGMIRLWIVLAAYCGLRAAEIAALQWDDLSEYEDEDGSVRPYLRIMGKGRKERFIPLSPFVWTEMLLYGRGNRGPMFLTKTGSRFRANYLDRVANAWLTEQGFGETFHQLRHRYGTMGARVTRGDLLTVGTTMGHGSLNSTKIYAQMFDPFALEMVDAIQPPGWPGSKATVTT